MRPNMNALLAFIRKIEARGNYDIVWGGIKKQHRPPKRLTTMTVQEVLDWQDSIDRLYQSEAAGAYQIMEDTLRELVRLKTVKPTAIFNEATQDQLAITLMNGRGLQKYLNGTMTAETFAVNLAKEWASLPLVRDTVRKIKGKNRTIPRGASYYAGDGLNKSLAKAGEFLSLVKALKADGALGAPESPQEPPSRPPGGTTPRLTPSPRLPDGSAAPPPVRKPPEPPKNGNPRFEAPSPAPSTPSEPRTALGWVTRAWARFWGNLFNGRYGD